MMRIKTPYIVLLLLFVVLGVYYPTIFAPINSIDDKKIVTRLINTEHFSLTNIIRRYPSSPYYRPLTSASFIADKYLWGLEPSFMHLENILLHACNVVILFFISRRFFRYYAIENDLPAFSAALLFALHPVNTEAVNWISGRTDVLAGTFILLSLALLLRSLKEGEGLSGGLAALAFLTGCFAKEVAFFFFPIALIIFVSFDNTGAAKVLSLRAAIAKRTFILLAYIAAAGLYLFMRRLPFNKTTSITTYIANEVETHTATFPEVMRIGLKALGFYAKKLFIPWPLNFSIISISDYYLAAGTIVVLCCAYFLYRRDVLSVFFLASASFIAPALLVAVTGVAWTPLAERYLYIPSATFSIGIVYLVLISAGKLKSYQAILPFAAVVVFSTAAYTTTERNIIWQDNLTLFQDTVEKSKGFSLANNDLAIALIEHGRQKEGYELLISNRADSGQAKAGAFVDMNRAVALDSQGDVEGARTLLYNTLHFQKKVDPMILQRLIKISSSRLEKTHDRKKQRELRLELIDLYTQLHSIQPDAYNYYRIGQVYLFMKDKREARDYFARAYKSAPDDAFYKLPAKKLSEMPVGR